MSALINGTESYAPQGGEGKGRDPSQGAGTGGSWTLEGGLKVSVGEGSTEGGDWFGELVLAHFRGHSSLIWFWGLFRPVRLQSDI